jgi:hypothetical protein
MHIRIYVLIYIFTYVYRPSLGLGQLGGVHVYRLLWNSQKLRYFRDFVFFYICILCGFFDLIYMYVCMCIFTRIFISI